MVDQNVGANVQCADRRMIHLVLIGSGIYSLAYLGINLSRHVSESAGLFGDFFAFWSFAKFVLSGHAGQIYDVAQLSAFERDLGQGQGTYPYPYPPIFLLLIWPLGLLPFMWAWLVWIATTFSAYFAAIAGQQNGRVRLLAIAAAPATLVTIISGQNGFLTAALLVGGFRLAATSPVIAGVLLGMLSYKPSLALMVPLALIAARLWATFAAASATVIALVGVSISLFGTSIWRDWFSFLPQFEALFDQQRSELGHLMPTVTANLLGYGVSSDAAHVVQLGISACVVVAVCYLLRRGTGPLAVAGLFVGTLLVTPYAFVYDMPTITIAVMLLVEDASEKGYSYLAGERIILLSAWFLPLLLIPKLPYPFPGSIVLAALLGFILLRDRRASIDRRLG